MAKQKLTRWFPSSVRPARVGYYDFRAWASLSIPVGSMLRMAYWDGEDWKFYHDDCMTANDHNTGWRGLAKQPKARQS